MGSASGILLNPEIKVNSLNKSPYLFRFKINYCIIESMENLPGVWKGYYTYNTKYYKNKEGVKTHFTITIKNVTGNSFSGTVEDDMATGGTPGTGRIEGTINGNKITFVKKMPVYAVWDGKKRILNENKSHPNIYYSGILNMNKVDKGKWKFKFQIFFINLLLGGLLGRGEWSMEKVNG